jgi:hypothetical protein
VNDEGSANAVQPAMSGAGLEAADRDTAAISAATVALV